MFIFGCLFKIVENNKWRVTCRTGVGDEKIIEILNFIINIEWIVICDIIK